MLFIPKSKGGMFRENRHSWVYLSHGHRCGFTQLTVAVITSRVRHCCVCVHEGRCQCISCQPLAGSFYRVCEGATRELLVSAAYSIS